MSIVFSCIFGLLSILRVFFYYRIFKVQWMMHASYQSRLQDNVVPLMMVLVVINLVKRVEYMLPKTHSCSILKILHCLIKHKGEVIPFGVM